VDVTAEDLALYLGQDTIDGTRAEFLIEQAVTLAASIISPVPDTAKPVVLAAAARAYINPQAVTQEQETVGPYSHSVQRPQAGLYFTRAEQAILKRLGGRGGAFTVDPTPADVDPDVSWPYDPENPFAPWDGEFGWERL
jgi:hypothetical protein